MLRLLKKLRRNERGNVLILTAAAMPLLVGSAGLAVDTMQWALWKRQLQRAADSAALAGVYARVQNSGQSANDAVTADIRRACPTAAVLCGGHTGIPLQGGAPTVSFPTAANWTNAVRVELAVSENLNFSSMFLSTPPVIRARATAATIATGVYCVVSLEPTSETGITATGNGSINLGCGMITNSTSLTAAIATGSSEVYATPIAAVGNIGASDNWNSAELLPFTVRQADPFENVAPPVRADCPSTPTQLRVNSNASLNLSAQTGVQCYTSMTLAGDVQLGAATYVIDGGDFNVGSQARVSCTGCTIILTNLTPGSTSIGQADINGGARLTMSAPTSGTYDGILLYQDRRATFASNAVNRINGNSSSLMTGAFYFPSQNIEINGTAGLNFRCAQFVSRRIAFSGNGSINNTCAGFGDNAIMGRHVRLVA